MAEDRSPILSRRGRPRRLDASGVDQLTEALLDQNNDPTSRQHLHDPRYAAALEFGSIWPDSVYTQRSRDRARQRSVGIDVRSAHLTLFPARMPVSAEFFAERGHLDPVRGWVV
jgi:hypothetical protein